MNNQTHTSDGLPGRRQLLMSTLIAFAVAAVLLVTVVMPAEYGIDPTRIGRVLGLTDMGEIKEQLHDEADADKAAATAASQPAGDADVAARLDQIDQRLATIDRNILRLHQVFELSEARRASRAAMAAIRQSEAAKQAKQQPQTVAVSRQIVTQVVAVKPASEPVANPAPAPAALVKMAAATKPVAAPAAQSVAQPAAPAWRDEASVVLAPGVGTEYKLVMEKGQEAEFSWSANGSVLNYDTHGEGRGKSIMYERGRGKPEGKGVLKAAFSGTHGWFWRNRTKEPVTLTIRARGQYQEFKRLK